MRYTRSVSGLTRLSDYRKKHRNREYDNGWYYAGKPAPKEQSEDTKIRMDINTTIRNMMFEGKNDVQIEIYLTDLYPNYSEYILKMISHQFSKNNTSKSVESKDGKNGEAR